MLEEYFNSKKIPIWEANYINIIKFGFLIKELSSSSKQSDERPKRFISFIEEEVKRIYIFYSSIEREVYLTINKRISLKKHYFQLGVEEIYGEMKKLKQISIIIYNFIKYINLNIGLIQKMTQTYKSAFPNDEINEIYKYFYYEVNTLNSDINYIFQYKIVDEVTVILDEFINILLERTNNKSIPFKMLIEEENMLSDSIVVFHTNTDNLKRNDNKNEFHTIIDENGEMTTSKNMKKIQKNLTISSALSKSTTYSEIKILEGTSNINNIMKEYKLKIYDISCEIRRNIEYIEATSMKYREGVLSINNFSFFDNKLLVNDSNNNNKHNLSIIGVGYDDNILSNPNQGILKYDVYVYNDENRLYSQIKKNMQFLIIYNFIYNLILYMPISQIFAFMYERSTNSSYSYTSLDKSKAEDRNILINESEKSYSFDLLLFILSIGIVYFLVPITNYISSTIRQRNIKSYIIFSNILFIISCLIIVFQANINDYIHLLNHSKFNVFCENSQFGIIFIISRVVLSMSSIKSLSKQYISKNSPNELLKSYIIKYNYSNYFGLLMSFLYNMILIFTVKKQVFLIAYSLILVIHFVYFLMFLLYFDKESIGTKDGNEKIDEEYNSNLSNTSNLDKKKENLLENENIPSSSNRKNSIRSIQTNTIQLSFEENNMINQINIDLNKVNKIQNFTSTNYLGSEIEEIINNEMNTISKSRFISKSFSLLFINTILFKSTFEGNFLLFSFLFVVEGEGIIGLYHVSLIMFLSLLMIIPVYILIKNVSRREAFIFSIFFMALIYFGLYYKSSVILYIILFPFIIGFTFFNDLYVSKIINEEIPSRYVVCKLNSELVIYNLSFLLKGVYFVLIGASLYVNYNVSYFKNQIFLFLSILHSIGLFLNIVMIRFLKGKAICRIINYHS